MAAVNNRLMKLLKANKHAEARTFIDGQKSVLSQADYDKLDTLLIESELLFKANQIRTAADGDSVLSAVEQARNNGKLNEKRAVELITFAVQKTASSLSASPAGKLARRDSIYRNLSFQVWRKQRIGAGFENLPWQLGG